ncbi:MAG: hypothetical protein U0996_27155 [Planctomycetaceae bacterium]
MGKFINEQEASDFLKTIEDPIVAGLVGYIYQRMLMSTHQVNGNMDLLYIFRILEEVLRDKEYFAQLLKGDYPDIVGWGT